MIKLENVTLDFPALPYKFRNRRSDQQTNQATGGVVNAGARGTIFVRALENISLTLNPGDKLALLGHNGAGKTTLLRVMAGLYAPTQGRVTTSGRVVPLLNLSFGMDMEATGYDNIWIRGLYLGMSRAEIKRKINVIALFSDLEDFLHLPMRTYSSGMRARLAFAISTHVDADVLLLDEVIATGDASFFHKARQQLEVVADGSSILVLASHSNKVLRELCNKGLLLEHGKIKAFGQLNDVIEVYKKLTSQNTFFSAINTKVTEGAALKTGTAPPVQHTTRVLLINDTGGLPNPKCQAVRKAYKLLFNKYIAGTEITASIPVNYWIENFREFAVPGKKSIRLAAGSFPIAADTVADIDTKRWESIRSELANNDQDLHAAFKASDLVVINGEVSIHHNSVRALSLLALAKTAMQSGKKVLLMNATLQQMMPQLLQEVLSNVALIHVREMLSKKYLEQLGIKSLATADLAFLALDDESTTKTRLPKASEHVLVTGGVIINKESLNQLFNAVKSIGLRPFYLSIGDGGETELARCVCNEHNVRMMEAGTLGVKELIDFLRQFPLAISGRHHINIFLMRAGVLFLPLPSNTWKVDGALKAVDYPNSPVMAYSDLLPALQQLQKNKKQLAEASAQSFIKGRATFELLLSSLRSCV